jgi:hypothetical protein
MSVLRVILRKYGHPLHSARCFVGFDPDLRAVREITEGRFRREIMINEAVVADETAAKN